ncbi:SusC/RagA family TonB-linked outer membrane protein [Catalinimonas alkaloidigena]|uniref:SusC/RagA family TonB-linked outer membrane protein n=1 Tax=Catalinimonas alkaloidigena TaxID=1075417 RepID=UPI002405F1B3|nr:SusC/RagA family TonB-linked outer membrane protein [Catalinimonas alkaloidigena]
MFCLAYQAYGQASDNEGKVEKVIVENNSTSVIANDTIDLGFTKKGRKEIVGAVSAIRPESYLNYDNTQWVRNALLGRITGLYGSDNIRGLGDAMIVVDGIPGRSIDLLNSEEIEQITVLKDANAVAQYGAMGRNGVIVVTTKRGSSQFRRANVIVNYGVQAPVSLPSYLGSADYMGLFNEARLNDGLDSVFSQQQIDNFRSGENPYQYPDVDFYSDQYLRPRTQYANVLAEFSGGSENTQYYINLGYNNSGSLVRLNPDANAGSHRFNVRGNIDFKVNDFISSSLDVVSVVSSTKTAKANLLQEGMTRKPHIFSPLLPVSLIDTTLNEELSGQVEAANIYSGSLLGGSQAYQDNTPVADVLAGGYNEYISRITQVNNAIDFDLSQLAQGLSAKTYISFDFYNTYALSVNNTYSIYEPTWSNETGSPQSIVALNRLGDQDRKDLTENASTQNFITRYGFYGMLTYDKQIGEKHSLNTSLIGFANNMYIRNQAQPQKNTHVAFQAAYSYDNKLLLDFSAAYVNSVKLPEGNRGKFSPTLGLAYVVSEENFLENSAWLNYLKLKASAGTINTDYGIEDYFLYREIYEQNGGGYSWADGFNNESTRILQGRNDNFGFEQRKDLNLGFETILFNSLWMEMNAFQSDIDKQVTRLNNQYPSYYVDFMPYSNYNLDRYQGMELGLNYADYLGQVRVDIGARGMYANSERIRVDEKYDDVYQNREGQSIDAYWGLEDQGFYGAEDFNEEGMLRDGLPMPAYGDVQAGDIRYIDQNKDGVVNDQDQVNIGRWRAPWTYSTNMRLEYKGFSLFVLGIGETGHQNILEGDYFWVDGDDKYSDVVLNRWTPETARTATFPRLSSQQNNNNFRNSTFWMYDNSYFRIQRAQLTYKLPRAWVNNINMEHISVYVAGSNLVEFARHKEKRQLAGLSSGFFSTMYRSFSVGLRAKF